jgi:2-oxoglutarate ferredoxin oxidoreductase subunit beta
MLDLSTTAKNTWCPGCTNFAILNSFKSAVSDLIAEGCNKDNFVMSVGIGCHGKIADFVNINSFISLHGREVATAEGIKLANPNLHVVAFAGDGDAYAEGIEHLIHAAKRNANITLLVHNNQVFGLTTGQFTPTSPKGFKGRSTPFGSPEEPFNPLLLMLSAGATFVARAWSMDLEGTKNIMKQAIKHRGFSIVDIIQPCITFADTREEYKTKISLIDPALPVDNLERAMKNAQQNSDKKPIGVFYKIIKPVFEDNV